MCHCTPSIKTPFCGRVGCEKQLYNINNDQPIRIKIHAEHIQALLEGKKVAFERFSQPTVYLIPDRYGVFMTMDKFMELRRKIAMQILANPDELLREAFGDDMFEKVFRENE